MPKYRNLIFLLTLLLQSPCFANDAKSEHLLFGCPTCEGEVLIRTGYVLCYDKVTKNATWTSYHLKDNYLIKKVSRKDDFRPDPDLKKGDRAELSDYKGSLYDRGHLVPANDMSRDKQLMSESFLLSNMSPQIAAFNRGIWKELEAKVRRWAKRKKNIHIFTGPLYLDKYGNRTVHVKTLGSNKLAVPTHFYKIVVADELPNKDLDAIAFIIPNKAYPVKDMPRFIRSIDEIEKNSNIDFLPDLPESKQASLERAVEKSIW